MPEKIIIAVADPHLGVKSDDVEKMIGFIEALDPEKADILFLGDLFHIWAAPEKYHTSPVRELLPALERFRQETGKVHLVVGNRDVFFREVKENEHVTNLPFDSIAVDFAFFPFYKGKLAVAHGDTVNTQDKRYLRWRRLIRYPWFQRMFDLLPAERVKKIMFGLEGQLKQTNLRFRKQFPMVEWMRFIERVHQEYAPDLLLIGHFHPDEPIVLKCESTTGIVVPDWHKNQSFLEIKPSLEYKLHRYTEM
ncbi:MAG: hypothetical protein GY866_18955 [Proteobacteria bacterium]|nr:hypothetical protein [Pseudomonadota bacterium]